MAQHLEDQIEIVCANAAEYAFEPHSYDVASCIGATFIWPGGFREALRTMRGVTTEAGRLIIGEALVTHSCPAGCCPARADLHDRV